MEENKNKVIDTISKIINIAIKSVLNIIYVILGIIAIISTCLGQPLSNETLDIFKNLIKLI